MKRLLTVTVMVVAATFTTPFATPAAAEDHEEEHFLETLQDYLAIAETFVELSNRPDTTVFFAIEGIVEIHEQRGEQAAAIPILREALDKYPDNQAVRNVIRFKLRDLYRETGQTDLALIELKTVIDENR